MFDGLPRQLRDYLGRLIVHRALLAWFEVDGDGRVLAGRWGDDIVPGARLELGDRLDDHLPIAVGMFPVSEPRWVLESVSLPGAPTLDLHFLRREERSWVVVLQSSPDRELLAQLVESASGDSLRSVAELVDGEDDFEGSEAALFQLLPDGRLVLERGRPEWLSHVSPGLEEGDVVAASSVSAFLEDHLRSVAIPEEGVSRSTPWVETIDGLGPIARECVTGRDRSGSSFAFVSKLSRTSSMALSSIQVGRQLGLEREMLLELLESNDTLQHCLVHDLSSPLTTILSTLEILGEDPALADDARSLASLAHQEALRQRNLIHSMLDVFAQARQPTSVSIVRLGPVLAALRPSFEVTRRVRKIHVVERVAEELLQREIRGDVLRLERVLQNLVENSLRMVAPGTTITIGAEAHPEHLAIFVQDEGPGVAAEVAGSLFDKMKRFGPGKGRLGLGLHFCRIAVESWGGRMSFVNLEPRGCRFIAEIPWVRSEVSSPQ